MGLYKRGNVYYMDFVIDGERTFKSTGKRNKHEALLEEAKERERIKNEKFVKEEAKKHGLPEPLKFSKAIDRIYSERWKYLRDGDQPKQRLLLCLKIIGDVDISEINADKIAKIRESLQKRKISTGTINGYLAHLKTLLNAAKNEWNILTNVPFIKLAPKKKGRIRVVTEEEEKKILEILRNPQQNLMYGSDIADLVEVLVDTGMRLGEALRMSYYENIDFQKSTIHLHPDQTKSAKPRSIPMTSRVKAVLQRRKSKEHKPFPFDKWAAARTFRKVRKIMGINEKEFVLHALRHTCATRLVNRGVDLYIVKEVLGHSTISVTEMYAHLDQSRLRGAISKLEDGEDRLNVISGNPQ